MPLVFGSLFNCVYKHAKVSFRNNKKTIRLRWTIITCNLYFVKNFKSKNKLRKKISKNLAFTLKILIYKKLIYLYLINEAFLICLYKIN